MDFGDTSGNIDSTAIDVGNGSKSAISTLNVRSLLAEALENNRVSTWLNGSSVVEVRVEKELTPNLKARFDIRYYRDGIIRTNVIMLNETPAYSTGNRNVTYDITVKQGSDVKLQFAGINHTGIQIGATMFGIAPRQRCM